MSSEDSEVDDVAPDGDASSGDERGTEESLAEAIGHLQVAAHEVAEALKLFGQAAEKAVTDPDGAGAALRRLADVGRAFVADLQSNGEDAADAATTDDKDEADGGAGDVSG